MVQHRFAQIMPLFFLNCIDCKGDDGENSPQQQEHAKQPCRSQVLKLPGYHNKGNICYQQRIGGIEVTESEFKQDVMHMCPVRGKWGTFTVEPYHKQAKGIEKGNHQNSKRKGGC